MRIRVLLPFRVGRKNDQKGFVAEKQVDVPDAVLRHVSEITVYAGDQAIKVPLKGMKWDERTGGSVYAEPRSFGDPRDTNITDMSSDDKLFEALKDRDSGWSVREG
jgi:hypothetical protein